MKKKLKGWTLTEGRIPGGWDTRSPLISEVISAVEAIRANLNDPFVILEAPPVGDADPCFIQALAMDDSYWCEICVKGENEDIYQQRRLLQPDEHGSCGEIEESHPDSISGYDPDLKVVIEIFMMFIANPAAFPTFGNWQWVDITADLDVRLKYG